MKIFVYKDFETSKLCLSSLLTRFIQSDTKLLNELQLSSFDQYTQGDYVYQQAHNTEISRGRDAQTMLSHRVVGGMGAIINALSKTIPALKINNSTTFITDVWIKLN